MISIFFKEIFNFIINLGFLYTIKLFNYLQKTNLFLNIIK